MEMEHQLGQLKTTNQFQPGTSNSLNMEQTIKEVNIKASGSVTKRDLNATTRNGALQESTGQQQTSNLSKKKVQSQGNQMGLHGAMYQLKLFILFLYRAISRKYSFQLGTEIKEANKFDDLVLEYVNDGRKEYRFLQAKHRFDESKKITVDNLLTESDGDYSLTKYFFSYIDSKKEKLFKDGSIKNVTICTNIDFDVGNLKSAGIEINNVKDEDDILDVNIDTKYQKPKQPKRYKFSKSIISLLSPKLQNYNLTRLARRLAECLLRNISIKHHDTSDIFMPYQFVLAEEIININSKNFRETFINDDISSSENCKNFRKLFIEELNRKSNNNLKLDHINEAIKCKRKIFDNKQVGLNLSKHFGKGDSKGWPDDSIEVEEVEDFIDHLVFAVNQPNQDELDGVLNNQIGKEFGFDSITTENVYNKFFITNLKWLLSKERGRFLSYTEGNDFLENARNRIPIWFDIREPIDLFIGRSEELEKLHEALQTGHAAVISQSSSIRGRGGIGKSELTRKYIHEHSEDYDNKIIWINAESYHSLSESFGRLAQDKLGISMKNFDGKEKHIKSIVEDVYRLFSRGRCLFVFDNAEYRRAENVGGFCIDDFLPSLPCNMNKPYVLITSRNREWEPIEVITLDVFTVDEAVDFIRKALAVEDDFETNEMQELVKTLKCLPIALQQSVAYIKDIYVALENIGLKFDMNACIKAYREEITKMIDSKIDNYNNDSNDLCTTTTYSTWKMTADKIRNNPECGHEAREILNIMAYLDADNINANLFLGLVNNSEEKLESAIQLLRHYSLIDLGPDEGLLNIHRLVQQVIRIYLKNQNKEEEVLEMAFQLLKDSSPSDDEKNSDTERRQILTHVDKFLSNAEDLKNGLLLPAIKRLVLLAGDFKKQLLSSPARTVLSHADDFKNKQIVPSVERVLSHADNFKKQQVEPTVKAVLSDADKFIEKQVVPTVQTVLSHADKFKNQHLVPTVETALSGADKFIKEQVAPTAETVISQADEKINAMCKDICKACSRIFK